MTKFKRIVTKNKRVMYFVDGKMAKAETIPEDLLKLLEVKPEFETDANLNTEVKPAFNTKVCIFDSEEATRHKFINGITVGLCNEDYQTRTSGQIVQQLNALEEK